MTGRNELISCCGSDCSTCYCYGKMCQGCNAVCGEVFHAPEGKACPSIVLEKNRRAFIKDIKSSPELALISMQNKRYKNFDQEMAEATLEGYKNTDNTIKARFPESFKKAWGNYRYSFGITNDDIDVTKIAFQWLEGELIELLEEYQDKPFKHRFTEVFIENVHDLHNDGLDQTE